MKGIAKIVLACALFGVAAQAASADSSVLNLSGSSTFDTSTANFFQLSSNGDTGNAAVFSGGSVNYLLGTVAYMMSPLSPLQAFTVSNGGNNLAFFITYNNATSGVDSTTGLWTITLDENGYYIANGGAELPGYFDLTLTGQSATGSDGTVPFSGSGGLYSDLTPSVVTDISTMSDVSFSGSGGFTGSFALLAAPAAMLAATPEPSSYILFGSGLLMLAGLLVKNRAHGANPLN